MSLTRANDAGSDLPLLVISGFGAHRVLMAEAGLHVLEVEVPGARGGASINRMVARVRVAPTIAELAAEPASAFVVRRYRFEPSPLVRDARHGWRSGRVREVMAGNFDLLSGASAESEAGARG